ncbi:MAG: hypothetical protein ACTHJR_02015 [Sphingomonas sp.]|uniref:hypothetical protein n=1 Tax=Sphingomonas sp. TaxID=28214 RepID=UPI003F80D106
MFRKVLLGATALAAMLPTAASAAWYQASSQHFVVYSNDSPERVKAYTEKLERFDKAVSVWHGVKEVKRGPAARVTIFVVDSVADVQKLYGNSGVAGFYISRGSGPVAFMPRSGGNGELSSQAILFHEYTHHWMFSNWADAAFPYWFVEGFAELHATALIQPNGNVVFGAQPTYRRWSVGQSGWMPAPDLLRAKPSDKLDGRSRDAVYGRGWLLLDYLTFSNDRRKQLSDYIGAINSGKSIDEAAKVFGNSDTLDLKMDAWAKGKVASGMLTADQLPIGEVTLRRLTDGEAAVMPALIQSKRGVDDKQAPEVVELARRLAAPFANDAGAQNELAEAEYDAASSTKDDAAALAGDARPEAAADRAIAADPKSVHALLYKGMAQEQIAVRTKVTDPAKWQAIRKWFLLANKIDTEDPEPLAQYYDSFGLAKAKPTLNAENALIYAYALAPFDLELRAQATRVLLGQNKIKEARVAIGPLAFNAEAPGLAERAGKVLAAIDANDVPGAIKLLDAKPEDKDKKDNGKKGS